MLPHGARRHDALAPLAAALVAPLEGPLPGELLGQQDAPLARLGVGLGPADLDRHQPAPLRSRSTNARRSPGSGISQCIASPLTGWRKPSSVACSASRGAPLRSGNV